MKSYLIVWNDDWADEFYIFGYEILSEARIQRFIKAIESMPDEELNKEEEFYFGTNEYITFTYKDMLKKLRNTVLLTDSEYDTIIKLFGDRSKGQYFFDVVYDELVDRGYLEWLEDEEY